MKNKKYLLLITFSLLLGSVRAQDSKSLFQSANAYYKNKQYEEAEKLYTLLIKQDKSNANAYYNLGNTYYHLRQYPEAVLNYERAKKLQPDNKYIEQNIKLTNNKLFSKIEFSKEFFVTQQLKNVVHTRSSESWSIWMLSALWMSVIAFCIHFFIAQKNLFRLGLVAGLCSLVFAYFTYTAHADEHKYNYAIILQQNANLKSAPVETMNATQSLQVGLKVEIIDADKNWLKIKLPNDKTGWIQKSSLELI